MATMSIVHRTSSFAAVLCCEVHCSWC